MPEILGTSKSIYGFDPRSVPGCCLWLDAADGFAVTHPLGNGAVTVWRDKSGLGNSASVANGSPVWTSNAIGGLPAMYMSNAPRFIGTFSPAVQTTSGLSVFAVAYSLQTSGLNHDQRLVSMTSNASGSFFDYDTASGIMPFDIQTNNLTTFYNYSTNAANLTNNALSSNQVFAASMVATSTKIDAWYNGTPFTTTGTSITSLAINSSAYGVGGGAAWTTEPWYGYIGEVLIYSNYITDAHRQAVEGYLAWKWGVNANLPTAHAFPLMKPHSRLFDLTDSLTPWIWFDGGDLNTFTLVSSTVNITAWSNKGLAGGSALSSSGSGTLSLVQMANGLTCVNFPANANLGFTIGIPNQPRAWFAVFKQTSQVSNSGQGGFLQYFAVVNQTTGNGQDAIFGPGVPTNGTQNTYNLSAGASGFISGLSTVTAPNGYNVFKQYAWVNSGTAASNTITVDGVVQTLNQSCNAGSYQTASVLYQIGDRYGNAGQVCEIIQFNSEITVGQRQSVESYLATKWGLAPLPITHPYYVFNPLSALPFSPTNIPSCIVWLDGDDPAGTGVRPASGSTVSSWKDKSGQSNHFTGSFVTAGTAPVWTPTLFNGCGGITMSGSGAAPTQGSYFLLEGSAAPYFSPLNVGTTCTFFIMCYVLSTSTYASRLISTGYTGQTTQDFNDVKGFEVQWYPNSSSIGIQVYRAWNAVNTAPNSYDATLIMFSVVFDGTNMYLYKSGVLTGTGSTGGFTGYTASTGSFGF